MDADADGYGALPGGIGCPAVLDCDDGDATVNASRLESTLTSYDDNCNARTAPRMGFVASGFFAPAWQPAGPNVNVTADGVNVGSSSSVTRASINTPLPTGTIVTVDVHSQSGPNCTLGVKTSEPGGPATWKTRSLTGSGVQHFNFVADFSPPESLREVKIECGPLSNVFVDWLTFQDAEVEFPPPADLDVTWRDTRLPAAAHSTAIIRDDHTGVVYFGDDVSGVWRYDGMVWEVANGEGASSLVMGGVLGVADLLPMQDGSGELYALMGDFNGGPTGDLGGLWQSLDAGDTWSQLGSSLYQAPGQAWIDATSSDDVAGDPRTYHCDPSNTYQAGGHLIEAHSIEPTSGDTLYLANADTDNMGVSIFDGTDICALPHTGDALPADYVSALLRVDALPNGTPALVVGYRARLDGADSLFVCELPAGGSTCGGPSAVCQQVEFDDGAPDVRDLERHRWHSEVAGVTTEAGVLVADAGGRPTSADLDCTYAMGQVGAIYLEDSGSGIMVSVEENLVTSADLPDVATGVALTGISFDPTLTYLFFNTPKGHNSRYSIDRAYRALADALFADPAVPVFEPLNASPNGLAVTPVDEEDPYEAVRRTGDMDMRGSWMEADVWVRPNVFPARNAPGAVPDFEWLYSVQFAWGTGAVAAGYNGGNGWLIANLAAPWTDNETDETTFNPADVKNDAESNVFFEFVPGINTLTELTPQGASTQDVAMAHNGHIWGASGDIGISQFDGTKVASLADPAGAEIDCLWAGFGAGAQSIHAVRRREVPEGEEDRPVVWATLHDQSSAGPQHAGGVVRTLDDGATWEYAGAGFLNASGAPEVSLSDSLFVLDWSDPIYGSRACDDRESTHVATPFQDSDGADDIYPVHLFSTGGPFAPVNYQSTADTVIGLPYTIRALDEDLALVWVRPDADGGSTNGGLLLTVDGGGDWQWLPFDGGAFTLADGSTGSCDEATVFNGGTFDLRPSPSDDTLLPWDGTDGALEFVVAVTTGAENEHCALAHVLVDDLGGTPTVAWDWIDLPEENMVSAVGTTECGVNHTNLVSATLAPWSSELMVTGTYARNYQGGGTTTFSTVYGGACLIDLNTHAVRRVIDPRLTTMSPDAAVPHPSIADLWVILPELDALSYLECSDVREYAGSYAAGCEDPIPLLVRGNVSGGVQLTPMKDRPPHLMTNSGVWSDLGVPDDSADGQGSYLVVGIRGGGIWRGELSW